MLQDKLKQLRRQAKLSQEQLAERLNVSRQAVTKWENGTGMPDIENLKAMASFFCISLDELLDNPVLGAAVRDYLFGSITEYDIDARKDFDITFMGAGSVVLTANESEKLKVRLASDQIADIRSSFKVKLDDIKHKIDIDIRRLGEVSEMQARKSLVIFISLPLELTGKVELTGNTLCYKHLGDWTLVSCVR